MATVLVIDDESTIVDLLSEIISDAGHTVLTACNGAEGFALALANLPDLIISDVMMPVMDGYALVKALRANPACAHIMVLLMSAAIRAVQAPSSGTAFTPKPLNLRLIEGILHQL